MGALTKLDFPRHAPETSLIALWALAPPIRLRFARCKPDEGWAVTDDLVSSDRLLLLFLQRPALRRKLVLLAKEAEFSVISAVQDVQKREGEGVVAGEFRVMRICPNPRE